MLEYNDLNWLASKECNFIDELTFGLQRIAHAKKVFVALSASEQLYNSYMTNLHLTVRPQLKKLKFM